MKLETRNSKLFPAVIPVAEAIKIVLQQTSPLPFESVPVAESMGRFLAADVIADSDLPPFDRSQMDGFAVVAEDTLRTPARLKIVGESAAGRGWHHELKRGEAVRIMTGAPVPVGADAVQQVELTRENADVVEILETVKVGRSIVRRASEIKAGEKVLNRGERINAEMIAVLASFGYAHVNVARRPRVAVLATGTELVRVDQQPAQDQIRDSNNYSISAYAELAGATVARLPLVADSTENLKATVAAAAEKADMVVTSGGVSMGVYDFTKTALRELDAEIYFERIALRPGKPTVFARLPNGTLIFGLPGNPVSVSVTFNLFARTSLLALQGATDRTFKTEWAILGAALKGSADRESYLPARLTTDQQGFLLAEPLKWGGSSDFVSFARATALIVVAAGVKSLDEGARVKVVRLPGS